MIKLVSGTEERLTDSISDLMVAKSFTQNSARVSPSIKRKHTTAISNYVLTLGSGVFYCGILNKIKFS